MGTTQRLSNDVLWHVAYCLTNPSDVLSLASTSRSLYNKLRSIIFIKEIQGHTSPIAIYIGAREDQKPSQWSILHWSAWHGRYDLAESMISAAKRLDRLEYLDSPSPPWRLSGPALTLAASSGSQKIVSQLLEAGCSPGLLCRYSVGLMRLEVDQVDHLLNAALKRTVVFNHFLSSIEGATKFGLWINACGCAILHGHDSLAVTLLELIPAEPAYFSERALPARERHITNLALACLLGRPAIVSEILNFFKQTRSIAGLAGAVDTLVTIPEHFSQENQYQDRASLNLYDSVPPLNLAVTNDHEDYTAVARILLLHGADIDGVDRSGKTALFWAARLKCVEHCLVLLETPTTRAPFWDYEGESILDLCARSDDMLLVTKRLLEMKRTRRFIDRAIYCAREAGAVARNSLSCLLEEQSASEL